VAYGLRFLGPPSPSKNPLAHVRAQLRHSGLEPQGTSDCNAQRATALSATPLRAPRSAAVSFRPDVAFEQLLLAMLQVTPSRQPTDLVIQ
jgi:hypothetical protein